MARGDALAVPRGPVASAYRVGFLLFPESPLLAFAAAIEPLRAANGPTSRGPSKRAAR